MALGAYDIFDEHLKTSRFRDLLDRLNRSIKAPWVVSFVYMMVNILLR